MYKIAGLSNDDFIKLNCLSDCPYDKYLQTLVKNRANNMSFHAVSKKDRIKAVIIYCFKERLLDYIGVEDPYIEQNCYQAICDYTTNFDNMVQFMLPLRPLSCKVENGRMAHILRLKPNTTIVEPFILDASRILNIPMFNYFNGLPENTTVQGDLIVEHTTYCQPQFDELKSGLTVNGNCKISAERINNIGKNVRIDGHLDVTLSKDAETHYLWAAGSARIDSVAKNWS